MPQEYLDIGSVDWRAHVVIDPAVLGGKPIVNGTRLSVEFIIELMAGGWSEAEILRNYPNLSTESLCAVLAYAAQNKPATGLDDLEGATE